MNYLRLKNKKASTAGLIVKAAIAIIVLFMISMIFFAGEDSQFAQIKRSLPSLSTIITPNQYSTPDARFADKEEKTKEIFGELTKGIQSLEEENTCYQAFYFVETGLDYSSLGDGLWIRINKKDDGMVMFLESYDKPTERQLKKNDYLTVTGATKAQDSSELSPCIIMGASAEQFAQSSCMDYVNEVTLDPNNVQLHPQTTAYDFSCQPFTQLIIKNNAIYVDGEKIGGIAFGEHLTIMRNAQQIGFLIPESTFSFFDKCDVGNKHLLSSYCFTTKAKQYYEGSCDYTYYDTISKTCTSLSQKINSVGVSTA